MLEGDSVPSFFSYVSCGEGDEDKTHIATYFSVLAWNL